MNERLHRKPKATDTAQRASMDVDSRGLAPRPEAVPEAESNMKPVSFYIDPADYKALKIVAADLGLGIGAGMRFAIRDFLKRKGAR
jgi:hypothetical protein